MAVFLRHPLRLGSLLLIPTLLACGGWGLSTEALPPLNLPLPIAQLQEPPLAVEALAQQSIGSLVTIQGQVTHVAPFSVGGLYQLTDDTGSVWVLTTETPPDLETMIRLQGQVQYEQILVEGRDRGERYLQERDRIIRSALDLG
ncbi:hypothetical protein [Leptolyngbya sp. PCC 6406]|uniref:hypothetical protein n=1 Tax=Leptolyngbya sp. PCC 6406 TaxID=1173264 RepID=UPI0012DCDC92|nr:hypothetical protein [Leptolyngbya sp. PCC 6406]